jgi:hypothetical protein
VKTIADFKRRMVVGTKVKVTSLRANHRGVIPESTVRTVSIVQSKNFATKLPDGREVWCEFPKAKDFRVDGPGTVTFLDSDMGGAGEPFVTFDFVP